LKKKAQEKLAAKANPVVEEAPAAEAVVEETVEAVVETPAEEAAAE
jgi:small subunit ribosomal protein S16